MRRQAARALVALALLAPASGVVAAEPACRLHGSRVFQRKADLPPGVVQALGFAIAERGAPFQATDVIGPGPRLPGSRFVAARQTACRLALRYEQGGIAHTWNTAILERRGDLWILLRRR